MKRLTAFPDSDIPLPTEAELEILEVVWAQGVEEAIPLTIYQGKQFTVEATVAGKPRTFLFDTGEGLTMIDPALAREAGCEPWGNIAGFRMTGDRLDTKRCDGIASAWVLAATSLPR